MTAQNAPLIDSHVHIWSRGMPLTDTAWHAPPTDALLETCLSTLDAQGVVFAVIAAASIHGEYFDYARAALKAHKRLRATAIVSPTTDIYQMEQMKADGFVGIRLMRAFVDNATEFDGDWRMHLARVADLGWHVHLIDKHERMADSIAGVEASGARLVIDHMGVGDLECPGGVNNPGFKAVLAAIDRGNTWVKISGRFRNRRPGEAELLAEQLLRVGGPERVLWASDWPFAAFEETVTYESVLADYHILVPDPDVRRKIDETALRFYFS
ncbi:MAG: amidohydrolase family protein [Rhodobacteraceae bacterium]|nr:amidohydrolase family protein [Paracoccaceae bacterium]